MLPRKPGGELVAFIDEDCIPVGGRDGAIRHAFAADLAGARLYLSRVAAAEPGYRYRALGFTGYQSRGHWRPRVAWPRRHPLDPVTAELPGALAGGPGYRVDRVREKRKPGPRWIWGKRRLFSLFPVPPVSSVVKALCLPVARRVPFPRS